MESLWVALGAILNGDGPAAGTLQALMGRANGLAVEWSAIEAVPGTLTLPILALLPLPQRQTGADGDTRRGVWQITAFAEGNGAKTKCHQIIERVEVIVTARAFLAQGLD